VSDAPLKPYESPVIPEETREKKPPPIGFIANFTMDAAGLKTSSRAAFAPVPAWIHWTSPLLIILLGFCVLVANVVAGGIGIFAFLFGSFALVTFIQSRRNRRVAQAVLERLQAHPVLGATGPWKLTVDRQQITVETPGGRRNFPRSETRVQSLEAIDLVIWFRGDLPIVVPERDPYSRMCKLLRLWFIQTADSGPK